MLSYTSIINQEREYRSGQGIDWWTPVRILPGSRTTTVYGPNSSFQNLSFKSAEARTFERRSWISHELNLSCNIDIRHCRLTAEFSLLFGQVDPAQKAYRPD